MCDCDPGESVSEMELGRVLPVDSDHETPSDTRETHTDSTCTELSEDAIRGLYKQLDDKVTTHTQTCFRTKCTHAKTCVKVVNVLSVSDRTMRFIYSVSWLRN